MPGKLIIPFHFHFHLMCRPYTPNLTAAFNTSQKSEEKKNKKQEYKSLTSKVMEPDHESLLTVNLNKEPFPFITLLHLSFKRMPQKEHLPPPQSGRAHCLFHTTRCSIKLRK